MKIISVKDLPCDKRHILSGIVPGEYLTQGGLGFKAPGERSHDYRQRAQRAPRLCHCWGPPADDAFLSPKPPAMPDGSVRSLKNETVVSDTGLAVDRRMGNPQISDDEILKYIYHPEHRFREVSASAIRKHGRYHLIPGLLTDDDPRVRHGKFCSGRTAGPALVPALRQP